MNEQIHGRGLAFPLRLGVAGLAESAGASKVEESIRIVLGTGYGERVMRPKFGCDLNRLAFAPNNGATADLARHHVIQALTQWEPRIELLDVSVTNDNTHAMLLIDIHYRLRATQDVRNLVYPFYLERGQ